MLVCAGVTQGVTLVCRALQRAGARRVAVEDPCFGLHREAIAMTGLEPVPVAVDERGLDVAALDAARRRRRARRARPLLSRPAATLDTGRRRDLVAWAPPPRRADRRGRLRRGVPLRPLADRRAPGPRARPRRLPRLGQQDGQPGAAARLDRGARPTSSARSSARSASTTWARGCSSSSRSPASSTAATSPATCGACGRSTAPAATRRSPPSRSCCRRCAGRAPPPGCTCT